MGAYSALARLRQLCIKRGPDNLIVYSKKSHELCKIFYKLGYISNYVCVNNSIRVSLRFHNNAPVLKSLFIYSRPGNRRTISYNVLKKKCKVELVPYLLSTDYGILTTEMALRLKTGGEILCKFV
jgi:ribosomal protein S8